MTCIVGIETTDGAVIGADAFYGSAHYADTRTGSKIVERNGWHIGVAGSSRLSNLLLHAFTWPKAPRRDNTAAVVRVATDIAKMATSDELVASTEGGQKSLASEVMLVIGGHIYTLGRDLGACRSRRGFAAIGSGDQYALGALAVTKAMDPQKRVLTALRAVAALCPTVRAPFKILRIVR